MCVSEGDAYSLLSLSSAICLIVQIVVTTCLLRSSALALLAGVKGTRKRRNKGLDKRVDRADTENAVPRESCNMLMRVTIKWV